MSGYLQDKLIDHVFRSTPFKAPSTLYVALLTASPTASCASTEVSGGSYTRVSLPPGVSYWTKPTGLTADAARTTSGQASNGHTITFPAPSADWGRITHFAIYDSASGGHLLVYGVLTTPRVIGRGDSAPTFDVEALTVTFAEPSEREASA